MPLRAERLAALWPVLEFETDDLSGLKERLLVAGCAVIEENPSIPRCYLRGPFGLIFNLRQVVGFHGETPGA